VIVRKSAGEIAKIAAAGAILADCIDALSEAAVPGITTGELDRLAERLGRLMPKGGKCAGLALLGEMAGVLSVSRAIGDARQSSELLAAKRKAIVV